ncbi:MULTISPECIES: helix-turn-helix transcriptional regulator [unclassified Dehalobacter]|uniref:helix-turn-helix domain-containing protein n=1 Tax=unclassified Dehalobacter TaxID=2635733 RepID=UPI00104C2302|nr:MULTISPECIES: helix-turn-helix transcriptional regulator [unclassified Dehalobacter]TCX51979.1 transcriptional regulator [Dehalobacter sp. 14DCB1]TCX53039.1 transcriptional regulator [Dehalobacter sp. 12DCB1]
MPRKATKAADSVYYLARIEAAACNDKLNSREGAAEIIGIDRTRLARIELGSLDPYPEEVMLMADAYNAPELGNHFCSCQCPLGRHTVPQIELAELDRLTLQVLSAFQRVTTIKDTLLDIASDGVIEDKERPQLDQVLGALDLISKNAQSLRLWAEKNIK